MVRLDGILGGVLEPGGDAIFNGCDRTLRLVVLSLLRIFSGSCDVSVMLTADRHTRPGPRCSLL